MIQQPNEDRSWSSEKWSPKEDSSVAESCQMNVVETEYSDYSDYSFSEPHSGNETCKQDNSEHDSFHENYSSEETVTVKFHINYENKTDELFTKAFNRNATVMTIKSELKSLLQIPQHHIISIQKDDRELNDDISLAKLGVPILGSVELHVRLTRVSSCKLDRDLIYGHMPTLDVITVRVQQNKNFVKHLVVEIEDERCEKPWLGGYRHRITRVEYHHAQTQTYSLKPRDADSNYVSRFTQAVSTKTQQTNTLIDKGVQITPQMFSIPSQTDRIITADSSQRPASSQTEPEYTSQLYLDKESEQDDEQEHSETGENTTTSVEINPLRMLRPLRDEIEKWNATQNALLNNSPKDRETATQRTQIINQTVKFLNRLNQFKTKLFQAQSSGQNLLFDKYTKSNTFTSTTGSKISIQTVFNQQAKTLKDLYMKYNNDTIKGVDKIRVIQDLINFFKGTLSKSKFSSEIVMLLEEQIDLLSRGLDTTNSLQCRVHQRIGHFLQYGGSDPNDDYEDSNFQIRYQLHQGTNALSTHNLDVYWHLLSHLRNDEIQIFKCFTSVCFKMRPVEFAYLVHKIWQDTPITQNDNNSSQTDQWIMTRWNVREEWTPWNCVLLTKPYFTSHLKADNVECYYDASVLSSVKNNHLKSKMYFQKLIKMQIV
ncbi:IQ motif and ubiquitin-like domain-containing protein [Planococcus citri]|uniref:IQ motif and ubiquitin-like domain-containing protein n=1 Tax=Planococcus citri TaxID=170843 RepID=UPI0031F760AA